jgi:hypothetical protein
MIGSLLLGWAAAALVALVPLLFGRAARLVRRPWMSVWLMALLTLAAGAGLLAAWIDADPEGGGRNSGVGAGVVVFVCAALPVLAFYSLGYRMRRDRVLGALWIAASVPFTLYLALLGIAFVNDVLCDPSCPLS